MLNVLEEVMWEYQMLVGGGVQTVYIIPSIILLKGRLSEERINLFVRGARNGAESLCWRSEKRIDN